MEENAKTTVTGNAQENVSNETTQQSNTPSVDELMAQLAEARAESQRFQNKYNEASSEVAKTKKALRAKQTAEEQEAEAKAEAERLAEEERETLRKENNRFKAMASYKNIDEKTVDKLLEAISESDHNAIALIIENEKKMAVNNAKAEWLKSRPAVNAGQYSSMTKEQIANITDREERRKAIAQNMDLFRN